MNVALTGEMGTPALWGTHLTFPSTIMRPSPLQTWPCASRLWCAKMPNMWISKNVFKKAQKIQHFDESYFIKYSLRGPLTGLIFLLLSLAFRRQAGKSRAQDRRPNLAAVNLT